MPKRTRSRTRGRAVADRASGGATSRAAVQRAPGDRDAAPVQAAGTPSASLQKAAAVERAYVAEDFRRLAVIGALTLALFIASGVAITVLGG